MAFISISITKNHPLILGKGGFGRQLADWLSAEGWGEAEFLDDSAPGGIVKAGAEVEALTKVDSGEIIKK